MCCIGGRGLGGLGNSQPPASSLSVYEEELPVRQAGSVWWAGLMLFADTNTPDDWFVLLLFVSATLSDRQTHKHDRGSDGVFQITVPHPACVSFIIVSSSFSLFCFCIDTASVFLLQQRKKNVPVRFPLSERLNATLTSVSGSKLWIMDLLRQTEHRCIAASSHNRGK